MKCNDFGGAKHFLSCLGSRQITPKFAGVMHLATQDAHLLNFKIIVVLFSAKNLDFKAYSHERKVCNESML